MGEEEEHKRGNVGSSVQVATLDAQFMCTEVVLPQLRALTEPGGELHGRKKRFCESLSKYLERAAVQEQRSRGYSESKSTFSSLSLTHTLGDTDVAGSTSTSTFLTHTELMDVDEEPVQERRTAPPHEVESSRNDRPSSPQPPTYVNDCSSFVCSFNSLCMHCRFPTYFVRVRKTREQAFVPGSTCVVEIAFVEMYATKRFTLSASHGQVRRSCAPRTFLFFFFFCSRELLIEVLRSIGSR